MTTHTISKRLARLFPTAIFGALALAGAAVSSAANSGYVPQVSVRYDDLNISSPRGAATLYGRIAAAAYEVCKEFDDGGLSLLLKQRLEACIHQAIVEGVTKVRQPALTAVYNAKNRDQLPITVIVARNR
jgi:UrcA family protein